jgi:hypothetical protein
MLKNFAIALLLAVAAVAAFIAWQPSEFLIVRGRTMAAPPEIVFAHVNDLHRWAAWSPWEKLDPDMKREHSGAPFGPGASYAWAGNEQAGEGRMTITDSQAPGSVTLRLEFVKPYPATNTVQFDILHGGLGTDVTWSMTGRNNFLAKAVSLFMDVDKMVGRDFEQGLEALDGVTAEAAEAAKAEAAAAAAAALEGEAAPPDGDSTEAAPTPAAP